MGMWKEEEHPRAEDGKFTDGSGKTFRQNTTYKEISAYYCEKHREPAKAKPFTAEDRRVLQSEVIRKNASGKGKYPTDYAYTANHFVIYRNHGECFFKIIQTLDLETYEAEIPLLREAIDSGSTYRTKKDVRAIISRIRAAKR